MLTCSTHKSYLDRQFPAPSVLQPSETWRDNVQLAQSLHMPCFLSFFMTPKHSFSLQTPGENRKVSTTFTTTCFAKEEPPEAERDEEAQEEHNEAA